METLSAFQAFCEGNPQLIPSQRACNAEFFYTLTYCWLKIKSNCNFAALLDGNSYVYQEELFVINIQNPEYHI